MRFNPEWANDLIPEGVPPLETLPPFLRELAGARIVLGGPLRAYIWATAINGAGFESVVPLPPRFSQVSAGYVWVNENLLGASPWSERSRGGFVFGASAIIRAQTQRQEISSLRIGARTLPLVITYGDFVPDGPPNPTNACASCWVENRGTYRPWKYGILTCRHAVAGLPLGTSISLNPSVAHSLPSAATLADIDDCTIDAAVLEINASDWPSGLNGLSLINPSSPGQTVQFQDRSGVVQSGTVLRVFHYGTYAGNLFGQRVIADFHGVGGDSGSLLADATTGLGVGLYMGKIPDGNRGYDGIFQDLQQVQSYFDLDLYM
jgi:hypothetical protein